MSDFNLLAWRERRRAQRIWHWRVSACVAAVVTCAASWVLQREWDAWLEQYNSRLEQQQQRLHALQVEWEQAALWQTREQQAQQVQADWAHWQPQQWQAWQLLQHLLSVPPRGVQIEKLVWRDQQLSLNGWALSPGHLQAWLSHLQASGLPARDARLQVEAALWSQEQGWAAKRHRFSLNLVTLVSPAQTPP